MTGYLHVLLTGMARLPFLSQQLSQYQLLRLVLVMARVMVQLLSRQLVAQALKLTQLIVALTIRQVMSLLVFLRAPIKLW